MTTTKILKGMFLRQATYICNYTSLSDCSLAQMVGNCITLDVKSRTQKLSAESFRSIMSSSAMKLSREISCDFHD